MRLLKKLVMKFVMLVVMVVVMGGVLRFARPYLMKAAGVPQGVPGVEGLENAHFSSEESDLMATVFKSALRLFTGAAKRDELASELSDKLYAGRADSATMAELGIELVKPGADSSAATGGAAAANLPPGAGSANSQPGASPAKSTPAATTGNAQPGAKMIAKPGAPAIESPAPRASNDLRDALLGQVWNKAKANPELALVPVALVGMVVVHRFKRRRSPEDAFMIPDMAIQTPAESEPYTMTHLVHALGAEDFELLVALIYQRQGYRVSMPAGLSGGRGGDFMLLRKSERLLVQCKKLDQEHRVTVERVRELHEAVATAGATRAMYVASCGFTWDARNFAKAKGVTIINARTLDALLTAAREKPDEDLLSVSQWAPKFMSKVKLTPPVCPACEAAMDQLSVSNGSVWVCSQRPNCRGRRCSRKHQKPVTAAERSAEKPADEVNA